MTAEAVATKGSTADPDPDRAVEEVGHRWLLDVLGLVWVVAAAAAVMAPALVHGLSLGPFDVLSESGLSRQSSVVVHNHYVNDQIDAIIPWTTLAWQQVHHGVLPLWNPFSALGMPLAFNWQSGVFSLPALIGYLAPLHLAYTVQVLASLVIAGTGVYLLARVLGCGVVGCTMAASIYELSGPFMAWLGWPYAATMAWAGWLFAAVILLVRGHHRLRDLCFVALVLALAVFAGQPEALLLLALSVALFLVVGFASRIGGLSGSGPVVRPVVDLSIATLSGLALGSPLLLPGLQLLSGSRRAAVGGSDTRPLHDLIHLAFQGFNGLPWAGSYWFDGITNIYQANAAYLGIIALVLAGTALVLRWRRGPVLAFAVVAAVMTLLVFSSPAAAGLAALPVIGQVNPDRAIIPLALALAALAGVGTDLVVNHYRRPDVRAWLGALFAAAGLALVLIWSFARDPLPAVEAHIQNLSFRWPVAQTLIGLAVVGVLTLAVRSRLTTSVRFRWLDPGRLAAVILLACTTAFLVSAGAPLWSSSPHYLQPRPAETALARRAGASLVAFGIPACTVGHTELGILQDVNIAYGVHELAVYDPVVPRTYFQSGGRTSGYGPILPYQSAAYVFCPPVTTVARARHYGAAFVLEPRGTPGPGGSTFDARVGDEDLYRIPGAAQASLVTPGERSASPVAVSHPAPSTWRLTTDADGPRVLQLHLTDVPGWHATIDGRPLALHRWSHVMLEADLPAGHHDVVLTYWPDLFTVGLVLATLSALGLLTACCFGVVRRRRNRSHPGGGTPAQGVATPERPA